MMLRGWSDEEIATVKRLCSVMSATQIAARLEGRTRNSVIGIIHRKGFNGRPPVTPKPKSVRLPGRQRPKVATIPKEKLPVEAKIGHPNSPAERALIKREMLSQPIEAPPKKRGYKPTLMDLKPRDCKWPLGDPRHSAFHFCGDARHGEGPYCAEHAALAKAAPGTGFKFDDADDRLIMTLWNGGRGLETIAARLGRPTGVVSRHATVHLHLPRAA